MKRIQQWLQKVADKPRPEPLALPKRPPTPPAIGAHVLDLWLQQATAGD